MRGNPLNSFICDVFLLLHTTFRLLLFICFRSFRVCQPVKRLQYAFTEFLNVAVKRQKNTSRMRLVFIALEVLASFARYTFLTFPFRWSGAILLLMYLLWLDGIYIFHMALINLEILVIFYGSGISLLCLPARQLQCYLLFVRIRWWRNVDGYPALRCISL